MQKKNGNMQKNITPTQSVGVMFFPLFHLKKTACLGVWGRRLIDKGRINMNKTNFSLCEILQENLSALHAEFTDCFGLDLANSLFCNAHISANISQ